MKKQDVILIGGIIVLLAKIGWVELMRLRLRVVCFMMEVYRGQVIFEQMVIEYMDEIKSR